MKKTCTAWSIRNNRRCNGPAVVGTDRCWHHGGQRERPSTFLVPCLECGISVDSADWESMHLWTPDQQIPVDMVFCGWTCLAVFTLNNIFNWPMTADELWDQADGKAAAKVETA